ncbi:MAG TPA: hypothetical protein VIK96_03455 [Bacilli bacterium]
MNISANKEAKEKEKMDARKTTGMRSAFVGEIPSINTSESIPIVMIVALIVENMMLLR